MPSYDIIEAGSFGYKLAWQERSYLAKLVAVPFLIKAVCFSTILLLGWEQNFVRQALVMLPSYFADGWFLSHLVRFVFLGQRWPFRPTGNTDQDLMVLHDRALGIMRGTLTFVVIKYLMAGLTMLVYVVGQSNVATESQDASIGVFLFLLFLLAIFFWAFRLLWLYIPAAINYPVKQFIKDLGGYTASWNLIGTWLFCFIPAFFVFGKILGSAAGAIEGDSSITDFNGAVFLINVVMDTLVAILTTAGIAFGIKKYILSIPSR